MVSYLHSRCGRGTGRCFRRSLECVELANNGKLRTRVHLRFYLHVWMYGTCAKRGRQTHEGLSSPIQRAFSPSLLQNWTTVLRQLILDEEQLTIIDRFPYLSSCVAKEGSTVAEVSTRMFKIWAVCTKLKHPSRRPYILPKSTGNMFCIPVWLVLLYC